MAALCEQFCPKINATKTLSSLDGIFFAFDGKFGLNVDTLHQLTAQVVESAACLGPVIEKQTIRKGIFNRKTVQADVFVCGLGSTQNLQTPTPSTTAVRP